MKIFLLALAIIYLGSGQSALADEISPSPQFIEPTRIEIDSANDVIKFFIEGQLAATLSKEGLHVKNNIEYGGTITDSGQGRFDELHNTGASYDED